MLNGCLQGIPFANVSKDATAPSCVHLGKILSEYYHPSDHNDNIVKRFSKMALNPLENRGGIHRWLAFHNMDAFLQKRAIIDTLASGTCYEYIPHKW